MERLTKRMPDGRVLAKDMIGKPPDYVGNGIPILEKLCDYEDAEEEGRLQNMSEWIKPSDKMPRVNEYVIICRLYADDELLVEQGHYEGPYGDWWKVYGTRVKTKQILGWMPMPDPPEWVKKEDDTDGKGDLDGSDIG